MLATDEFFANAVQHGSTYADDSITVTIECGREHLRIAVTDSSALFPLVRGADAIAEHGRGMAIVAAISDTWGAEAAEDGRGKQVWFTMRVGSTS